MSISPGIACQTDESETVSLSVARVMGKHDASLIFFWVENEQELNDLFFGFLSEKFVICIDRE